MIIIVDAYNVIKLIKQGIISQAERTIFIKKLLQYSKSQNLAIVAVFDGGLCTWPMIEKKDLVSVVYSGERLSADDYIRRYLKEHSNKELLLVTNDRELKRNAKKYGVDSLESLTFHNLLYKPIKTSSIDKKKIINQHAIKLSQDSLPEVDALMKEVDVPLMPPEEDASNSFRQSTGFTASKKERKINKKMKKLYGKK